MAEVMLALREPLLQEESLDLVNVSDFPWPALSSYLFYRANISIPTVVASGNDICLTICLNSYDHCGW